MAPESQNEMIELLADDVRQRIADEIKEANMFGVSADTTPDLSKQDQMAVVCRYVNTDGNPKETLLSIKSIVSKKGADTADEIITTLNNHTLGTLTSFASSHTISLIQCLDSIMVLRKSSVCAVCAMPRSQIKHSCRAQL